MTLQKESIVWKQNTKRQKTCLLCGIRLPMHCIRYGAWLTKNGNITENQRRRISREEVRC